MTTPSGLPAQHQAIVDLRKQIVAKREELSNATNLPIPRAELVERFRAMVDARAERFGRVPPSGQTWRSARDMVRVLGDPATPNARIEFHNIDQLADFLYFFAGDVLKANATKLLTIEGWRDGLPANKRAETSARLARELAELEAKEEQAIDDLNRDVDAANAAARAAGLDGGMGLYRHRPEVVERRTREASQRDLENAQAGDRRQREAAINERHARAPRTGQSEYLQANASARSSLGEPG